MNVCDYICGADYWFKRRRKETVTVMDSRASRMNRTQWMREQAWVTISGEESRLQRPGSCRARQQQSRPACRSRLSGICSWIKCHDRAWRGRCVLMQV